MPISEELRVSLVLLTLKLEKCTGSKALTPESLSTLVQSLSTLGLQRDSLVNPRKLRVKPPSLSFHRNVSEEQQVQAAVQHLANRLRLLFQNALEQSETGTTTTNERTPTKI